MNGSKTTSLEDALAVIEDGDHVGLTGFAITRNAVAAALTLTRTGRRDLQISQVVGGLETDILVGGGCVSRLVYSGGSLDRFGPLHSVNRAIGEESIEVEEYSSLSLTLRLEAAALGLPYVPSPSMIGSELVERLLETDDVESGTDPFTGRPVMLFAPLRPDVTIVHADVADGRGNSVVSGPLWSLKETATAARSIVVTCEELVEAGSIPPDRVTLPGSLVGAVAEVPNGAAPTAVYGHYDYDRQQLIDYVSAAAEGGDAYASFVDSMPGEVVSS